MHAYIHTRVCWVLVALLRELVWKARTRKEPDGPGTLEHKGINGNVIQIIQISGNKSYKRDRRID